MEEEAINFNEVIAKLKIRIFDLETKVNEVTDKLNIIYALFNNARKLLEKRETIKV